MDPDRHTGRRLVVRLLIAMAPTLVAILVWSNPPWFAPGTAPWACALPVVGMVLAFAALILPTELALALVAFLSPVALGTMWVLAWFNWESGNDGGGFYWFLIIGPAIALTGVLQWCMGLVILSTGRNRSQAPSVTEQDEKLRPEQLRSGRWFSTPVGAALLVAALVVALDLITRVIIQHCTSSVPLTHLWLLLVFDRSGIAAKYAILALAPCICLRDVRKALPALASGVAVGVLSLLFFLLMMSGQALFGMSVVLFLQGLNTVLSGMILGYVTAWAYGSCSLRRTCLTVGALSGTVVAAIGAAHRYLADRLNAGPFHDEITTSLSTICAFILSVPLGVAIERHLRKQESTSTAEGHP